MLKMFLRLLLLFAFVICIHFSISQNHQRNNDEIFSIGIILEQQQENVPSEISTILRDFEISKGIEIQPHFITINRENGNETMNMFCRDLYNGISIFLDLSYTKWEEGLNLINSIGIPCIKIDISIGMYVNIAEDYLKLRGNATDATLIFQNEKDLDEAIIYLVKGQSGMCVLRTNAMDENFIQIIKKLRPAYYVIFATNENMNLIFKKILDGKIFSRPDKWHLFFLDFNSEEFLYKELATNATKISPDKSNNCFTANKNGKCELLKGIPLSNILIEEVLSQLTKLIESNSLPLMKWNCENELNSTEDDIEENADLLNILQDSKLIWFKDDKIVIGFNMTMEIYTTANPEGYKNVSVWNQGEIKTLNEMIIEPPRTIFRIGTTEAIPWSYINRDSISGDPILDKRGNLKWEGYCIDMIAKLAENMNFDYEIVTPKHGTFGKRLANGQWDGLIGDLVTGEIDVAIAALKMTSDREEVIDFVAPYFEQTGILIVIRRAVQQTSLFKFLTILRLEVWMSIIASVVATAIIIWLMDMYSPYSAKNNKKAYPYPCREFTLKESLWFTLTSFTPQGGGETPKAISGRILVAAYWLFVVLMLATFTANLAAFLTVEKMQTPVQSLEQLGRQSRINYTVVEGSDTHKYFINMKNAEDTLYRMWKELTLNATSDSAQYRIWDYPIKEQYGNILIAINSSNPVKNATEGYRLVNEHENANFAFIHDSAEIKYEITKSCNLTEVGEVFAEQPYAIAVQQGSNLQDEFSYAILDLQKERFFDELKAKYWNNSKTKECSGTEDNEGIGLESLGGVFISTLFGLLLAVITLVGEIIYYGRKSKNSKQVDILKQSNAVKILQAYHPMSRSSATPQYLNKEIPKRITFGDKFIPSKRTQMRVSYIPVQPRNPLHGQMSYYE